MTSSQRTCLKVEQLIVDGSFALMLGIPAVLCVVNNLCALRAHPAATWSPSRFETWVYEVAAAALSTLLRSCGAASW